LQDRRPQKEQQLTAVFQHALPYLPSQKIFDLRRIFNFPTTRRAARRQATFPVPQGTGPLVPRGRVGHLTREPRGAISPHAGEGRGFYPSMAPRSRAKALRWWGSAPSLSLPGRSRDGSIPFGMRRGPPRAHIPPGPSRLDPVGFRPVAALGETVRTVFCRYLVSVMGAVGLSESL
jgi:hypothetical protein